MSSLEFPALHRYRQDGSCTQRCNGATATCRRWSGADCSRRAATVCALQCESARLHQCL